MAAKEKHKEKHAEKHSGKSKMGKAVTAKSNSEKPKAIPTAPQIKNHALKSSTKPTKLGTLMPAAKTPMQKTATAKSATAKTAAGAKQGAGHGAKAKPIATAADALVPATKRAAVVPTQKHVIIEKISTHRINMASPAHSKAATAVKAPVKPVAAKPSVVGKSAAPAAAAVAGRAPHAKATPHAATAKAAAGAPSSLKPATAVAHAPALDAAQVHAHRQAALKAAPARSMPAAVANTAGQRSAAPAAVAASVLTPKDLAHKAQLAQQAQQAQQSPATKKPVNARHGFKTNEWIVYPAHGVGRIVAIEEQEIAGMALELFVITFEKDKMTLRVPTGKSASVGMRKLAEEGVVKRAMETLKGKARIKRTMWSRRAQEFEQKINSGDLVSIAEVVRDLFRAETQPEQSYSERQLYEAALDRMAREIAAVEKIDERGAVQRVTEVLSKSAKTRRADADAASAAGDIKAA